MSNNNTNPDNQPNQTPNRRQRQAKKPAAGNPGDRTDEAGYQKLPHALRPFAGCAQRDPLDYDSHPYPSMLRFAKHLALHFDAPRTRHSYYRQLRLLNYILAPFNILSGRHQTVHRIIPPGNAGEHVLHVVRAFLSF